MDIQLMREFIALVNLKSYRKVAQQFHIAPSTLSRHIKAIGKELGQKKSSREPIAVLASK